MSFVSIVPFEKSNGLLKEQYQTIAQHTDAPNEVNRLVEAWSLQPEVAAAWMRSLSGAREQSGLDRVLYELIECRIMYLIKCRYVLVNHCYLLARASGWDHDRIKRSVQDPAGADLEPRAKAVLRFAEKACLRSHEIRQADMDELRSAGFNDAQCVALVFMISALVANAIFPNALGAELNEFSKAYRDIANW